MLWKLRLVKKFHRCIYKKELLERRFSWTTAPHYYLFDFRVNVYVNNNERPKICKIYSPKKKKKETKEEEFVSFRIQTNKQTRTQQTNKQKKTYEEEEVEDVENKYAFRFHFNRGKIP